MLPARSKRACCFLQIIVDLTAHNKRLESENSKLRKMVSEVRDLLKDCRCAVPLNTTTALLEVDSSAESKAETPSAYEKEKEEVELLGGRASEGVSEPLAKSQLGLTNVRMGHALAGSAQAHVLREGIADRLGAEDEAEAATLPRGVGMDEGKPWPRAGRGYGEGDALLGEAQPRGSSVEG
jgi:hypothetical protein